MPATVLSNIQGYAFEPDIVTDNGRDGISQFQFSIIGSFSTLNSSFELDEQVNNVPDQPKGNFRVVRRNLSHIAGDAATGIYRLSISCEGGSGDLSLYILETSYQYQKETITGYYFSELGGSTSVQYVLEWLSPCASITTNSQNGSVDDAQALAQGFANELPVQIVRRKPATAPNGNPIIGQDIDENKIIITGSSVEKAGGLYRVKATATKGQVEESGIFQ